MDRIKKLVLILVFFIITLSSMFLVASKSYAEDISNDFAKGVTGRFDQKSMAGIYYAMRTRKSAWVDIPAPSNTKKWGIEYGADGLNLFKDQWYTKAELGRGYQSSYGMIGRVGALCFGHEYQTNGTGSVVDLKVYDIDKSSSATYHYLAYCIYQSVTTSRDKPGIPEACGNVDIYWKACVRGWLFSCFNDIQVSEMSERAEYGDSSAQNYAKYMTNKDEDTVDEENSNHEIKIDDNNTFIGPYKNVKIVGTKDYTTLSDKIKITDYDNKTNEYEFYFSTDGKTIRNKSEIQFNTSYTNFYIVVKNKKISSVKNIQITKTYKYYKARLVVGKPHPGTGQIGQFTAIFYGYEENATGTLTLPGVPYTKIRITKTDADTNQKINDEVKFIVKYNGNGQYLKKGTPVDYTPNKEEATKYTTTDGIVEIEGIKDKGTYTIYEVGNSNRDYLEATVDNPSKEETVTVSQIGGTIDKTITNEKVYYLKIRKVDKDSEAPLENVGFILYYPGKGYVKDGENGKTATYEQEKTKATVYKTDKNGETIVKNLPDKGPYTVYEVENPNFGYEEVSLENPLEVDEVTAKLLKTDLKISDISKWPADEVKKLTNKKKYIKLSGYVWVDDIDIVKPEDKDSLYNTSNAKDLLFNGITVMLKDKRTGEIVKDEKENEIKTTTSQLNRYTDIGNNGNGEYLFEKVLIEELKNYYIEFEYDGLTYTNVIPHIDKDNGSKAEESDSDRTTFNEKFSVVEGDSKDTGHTTDAKGIKGYDLKYDKNGKEAILSSDGSYEIKTDSNGNEYMQQNSVGAYTITADTEKAGYSIKEQYEQYEKDKKPDEIRYINLGLYEREQPDVSLKKDLHNVKVSINGYDHVYLYDSYYTNMMQNKANNSEVGVEWGYEDLMKDNLMKDKEVFYTQAIYKSDYEYENETDKDKELKVYITYELKMVNQSTSLFTTVNSIVDYYDSRYNIVSIGTKLSGDQGSPNGDIAHLNEEKKLVGNDGKDITTEKYNNNYRKIIINNGTEVNPTSSDHPNSESIYVQFELTNDLVEEVIHFKGEEPKGELLKNVAEINSYSTFSDSRFEKIYAGIDEDSNPGNCVPEETDKYEDDTFACPALKLEEKDKDKYYERSISGTVFLDESVFNCSHDNNGTANTHTGEKRNGDGEYQDETPAEKTISGVKVQLYENTEDNFNAWDKGKTNVVTGNASGTVVYLDENDMAIDDATSTGSTGKFKITGFIPGKYVIVYTWGNNTYIQDGEGKLNPINVNDYKGTIYKEPSRVDDGNHNWYQEKKANNSILDWYRKNYDTRYSDAVDNYELRKNIDEGEFNSSVMLSRTPAMNFGIELDDAEDDEKKGTSKFGTSKALNEKGGREVLRFDVPNVDFGITERARQEIAIDKRIDSVRLTLVNGQDILYAEYEENEDGKEGELKVKTGAAQIIKHGDKINGKWTNGQVWESLDNELIQGSTLEITYKIIVNNNSEKDYDTDKYYLYGPGNGEDDDKIVKQKPQGVYDYLDSTMSFDASKQEDTEAMKVMKIDTDEGYNKNQVKHNLIEGYLDQYEYSEEDDNGVLTNIAGYEYYSDEWKDIMKIYWEDKTTITEQLTKSILNEKTIIEIGKLENEMLPGGFQDVSLKTSKQLTSTDEIAIDNEVEIVDVERTTYTGRKTTITTSIVYNRGETVIITPPTGDDKNYLPYIILGITSFIILGAGVVFIKKKVLK